MLEPCMNQAAGLQGLAPPLAPKLMAVVSHGDQTGELALLWRLCATWVELGLSVLVLDGHADESPDNPGLRQQMEDPLGQMQDERDTAAWAILPAAGGLSSLAKYGLSITSVGNCLQKYGVVLVYANPNVLSRVLKGSNISPLLVVSPPKTSKLTAYQAMKEMYLDAYLQPTVANITLHELAPTAMNDSTQNLQDCAQSFLGLAFKPITISANHNGQSNGDEIQRLALQLLESAVTLDRQPIARTH